MDRVVFYVAELSYASVSMMRLCNVKIMQQTKRRWNVTISYQIITVVCSDPKIQYFRRVCVGV